MTVPDPITLGEIRDVFLPAVMHLLTAEDTPEGQAVDSAIQMADVLAYLRDLADRIDRQEDDGLDDEAGRGFSEFDLVDAVKSLVRREGEQ